MAKNALISWSNLTDSAGRKINEYTLAMNKGGIIDWMPKIYMVGVDFLWNAFMFISALAATALSWIGNPSWLNGLDNAYKKLTESMFSIVNPMVLATLGFVLLMFFIFIDSVKSNSTSFDKNDYNRVAAGFFMMVVIAALAANPFALLKIALSVVQTGVASIAGKDAASLDVFSVDAMIRQPTLIITYNGAVNEKCANLWSKTGGLEDNGACFDVGQNQPSAVTLVLAFLAFLMSVAAFAFAAWAAWKYIKHLTIAVLGFVSLPWVAAMSMFRRRQFDQLGTVAAVAAGNMMMVFIVQVISLGGPTLVSQIMSDWGQTGSAVLQMIVLMLTYVILLGALVTATNKSGPLVRALKADTSTALRTYMGSPGSGWNLDAPTFTQTIMGRARNTNIYRQLQGKAADIMGRRRGGAGRDSELDPVQTVMNMTDDSLTEHLKSDKFAPTSSSPFEITRMSRMFDSIGASTPRLALEASNSAVRALPDGTVEIDPCGSVNAATGAVMKTSDDLRGSNQLPVLHQDHSAVVKFMGGPDSSFMAFALAHVEQTISHELEMIRIGQHFQSHFDLISDQATRQMMATIHSIEHGTALRIADNSDVTVEALHELYAAIMEMNRHMETPLYGGRTPDDMVRTIVHDVAVAAVKNVVTNMSTTVINNVASTNVGVSAGSFADQMREFHSSRQAVEAVHASSLSEDVGVSSVQHTVSQPSSDLRSSQREIPSSRVRTHLVVSPSGKVPSDFTGSPATRGDVSATRVSLPAVCDRAEDEVLVETAVLKNRAQGKGGYASYPLESRVHDIRFTPDRPGQIVSAAVGVGFGDDIY